MAYKVHLDMYQNSREFKEFADKIDVYNHKEFVIENVGAAKPLYWMIESEVLEKIQEELGKERAESLQ